MRVHIEKISKIYPDPKGRPVEALRDITFTIQENEFVAVVGPSGCGKSTLLHIVAGLASPSRGQVFFLGAHDGSRPLSGVVFQDLALFPWRTARENIVYGLEERGMDRARQRELAISQIATMGLQGFEEKYPHQLSGGMKQRVAIARALVTDPFLLLMDEPFSALDAQSRALMQEELSRIWEGARKSALYITHHIPEAVFLADRVVVLSRRPGRILEVLPIDLPRPRAEAIQRHPRFQDYVETIWTRVRKEAAEAFEGPPAALA